MDGQVLSAPRAHNSAPGVSSIQSQIHTDEYKNVGGTGNPVKFNGMDWWKSDGEKYIENWVFVDMVYLFRQLGVDLFDRLAK